MIFLRKFKKNKINNRLDEWDSVYHITINRKCKSELIEPVYAFTKKKPLSGEKKLII